MAPFMTYRPSESKSNITFELVRPAVVRPAGFEPATRYLEGIGDGALQAPQYGQR
jgi:hypothetical protein